MVRNPPGNAGDIRDAELIPGLGRSPGGEHSNPLHYSCLQNPMERRAWQATIHRVAKSWTRRFSTAHDVDKLRDTHSRSLISQMDIIKWKPPNNFRNTLLHSSHPSFGFSFFPCHQVKNTCNNSEQRDMAFTLGFLFIFRQAVVVV